MALFLNKWIFFIANLLLSTLLYLFFYSEEGFIISYLNILFYIVSFYLFIMLALIVLKGGFFDGITYGTRKVASRMRSNKDYLNEWEKKKLPSTTVQEQLIRIFFWQGLLLGIVMTVFLFFYFNSN